MSGPVDAEARADIKRVELEVDRAQRKGRSHDNDMRALHALLTALRKDITDLARTVDRLPTKKDVEAIRGRITTVEHRLTQIKE